MGCERCRTFFGDPLCSCCLTIKRIADLGKRLAFHQERVALQLLRDCAGGLADLAERAVLDPLAAANLGSPAGAVPGPAIPEVPAGLIPEKEDKTPLEKKPSEEKPKKESGRPKEKKKKKSKTKEGENSEEKSKKRSREEPARSTREEEEIEEEEAKSPEREQGPRLVTRAEVEERPEDHGLTRIAVRGSAGKHFDHGVRFPEDGGRLRPPEPEGSPPRGGRGHHGASSRGSGERSRSRERQGRWRGYKHFLRGKEHWKNIKKRRK
eukprot:Skav221599  [mRNA]  locus=scaffold1698:511944:512741:+ [translate_table: standard]